MNNTANVPFHTHEITEISGLQEPLNDKVSRVSGLIPLDRVFEAVEHGEFSDRGVGRSMKDLLGPLIAAPILEVGVKAWRSNGKDSFQVQPTTAEGQWFNQALPVGLTEFANELTGVELSYESGFPGLTKVTITKPGEYLINFKCRVKIDVPKDQEHTYLSRMSGVVRIYSKALESDGVDPADVPLFQHDIIADILPSFVRPEIISAVGVATVRHHEVNVVFQLSCRKAAFSLHIAHMVFSGQPNVELIRTPAHVSVDRTLLRVTRIKDAAPKAVTP